MSKPNITFIENPAIKNKENEYISIFVNISKIIESWRLSLFSFEWLDKNGELKPLQDLPEKERIKRIEIEKCLKNQKALTKPILGIGITDHVEIGSGRAEFLTLAALGIKTIPVYIPKSNESDFKNFLAHKDP